MNLLALSFVHPALLGGFALASLPIVIHILNRRRFKEMEWAAMDFLLKAAVRNRRRVRLENLILLALRVLLVCVLVLAVARPFAEADSFAGIFGSEGAVDRIILLDDSHSMRAGTGNRAAFARARDLAKDLIRKLHESRSPDRVSVVLGSAPRRGDRRITRVAVAGAHAARMIEQLDRMRVSDGTFDLVGAVEAILEAADDRGPAKLLQIFSDFRRRDWTTPDGGVRPDVLDALARFAEVGQLRLIDVGGPPIQNAGVVDLKTRERAVITGVPATFLATVRNHGPEPWTGSVTFRFGRRHVAVPIAKPLQPGEEVEVSQEYTLRTTGPIAVSAEVLPSDILPGDSVRRRIVRARAAMRFLLVDGEPSPEPYRGETDYLAAALAAPGAEPSGIGVEVVAEHAFTGRELEDFDGAFFCNLYRLDRSRVARVEDFVRGGGGLVFFLGDQVDPQLYNVTFYGVGKEAGLHLLPLPLGEAEGSSDDYVHFAPPGHDHPVLKILRGLPDLLFRTVAVRSYLRTEPAVRGPGEEPRVLLTYTDEAESVALAEKPFGDGRVLLFTTAADSEWSDYPLSPLYVALLHEVARYVVKPDPHTTSRHVFDPIEVPVAGRRMQPRARIVPPAESGRAAADLVAEPAGDGAELRFRYEGTELPGVYALEGKSPQGEALRLLYAVNVDPSEGDLRRAEAGRIAAAVPGATFSGADEAALLASGPEDRSEFWRLLVYALAAAALLETFLAWRFGHHHTGRLETAGKRVFVR